MSVTSEAERKLLVKPKREDRVKTKKPMRKIGKVGRARLDVVAELNEQWSDAPFYNTCELRPVLLKLGLLSYAQIPCVGEMTWAHARKGHRRSDDASLGSPENHYTAARGCTFHHMAVTDLFKPSLTQEIVMQAIAARHCGD